MQYKVNEEGVAALRTMGDAIMNSIERIAVAVGNARGIVDEYENTLGPHASTLNSALEGITTTVKTSADSAMEVSTKLHEIADDYEAIIDDDPYVRSIGARTR